MKKLGQLDVDQVAKSNTPKSQYFAKIFPYFFASQCNQVVYIGVRFIRVRLDPHSFYNVKVHSTEWHRWENRIEHGVYT